MLIHCRLEIFFSIRTVTDHWPAVNNFFTYIFPVLAKSRLNSARKTFPPLNYKSFH